MTSIFTKTILTTRAFLLLLAVLLSACSHPIEIIGEGDVLSASGNRDCSLEDYQAGAKNCAVNLVAGEYSETYYAMPRQGWQFNGWGNYCRDDGARATECTFHADADTVKLFWGETMPPLRAFYRRSISGGYNSLLIGHSFFIPFVELLNDFAHAAGLAEHANHIVFSGNATGAPINLWYSIEHSAQIKGMLDTGDVGLFGLAYYPFSDREYNLQGYMNWVYYAVSKNPDTKFFIGLSWLPHNAGKVSIEEHDYYWETIHKEDVHYFIDQLRLRYPGTDFFCIPYGRAAMELRKLFEAGDLIGVQSQVKQGSNSEGIFSDVYAHPDNILVELGSLVWIKAIYGIDLTTFDYERLPEQSFNTRFPDVDLAVMAEQIMNLHNHYYDSP